MKNYFSTINPNQNRIATKLVCFVCCGFTSTLAIAAPQDTKFENPRVPATVRAYESVDLYAKVGGYVATVTVDIGDKVAAGDVLATIDVPETRKQLVQKQKLLLLAEAEKQQAIALIDEAKAHLDALQAAVEEAETMRAQKQAMFDFEKSQFDRITGLASSGSVQSELVDEAKYKLVAAESGLIAVDASVASARASLSGGVAAVRRSEADAAAADARIDVAQADLDYVEQMMSYSIITAPWAGKVAERMYDPGAYVQGAQGNSGAKPILKLVRDDKVKIAFSLSQKHLTGLKPGVPVTLSNIDALPGETFEGSITRYSAELDAKSRMMRVEVDLDNGDGRLTPGFFGYVTILYFGN